MARTPRYGLCYASIFSGLLTDDPRIDKLVNSQGWRGVGVFMYLLLRAYGDYGYFTEWCYADCATTARKMGGGISAKQVEEAICCCVQVGLFDKGRLESWGILTSTDIQEAYLAIAKGRRLKVLWKPEYWILAEKPPAASLVSCGQNADKYSDKAQNHRDKGHNHRDNPHVKVIGKGNPSDTTTTNKLVSSGQHEPLLLSSEDMEERKKKYGSAINHWERVTARVLPPYELDRICELVDEYGSLWVVDAMGIAGDAGRPNIRYVQGILTKWRSGGRDGKRAVEELSEDEHIDAAVKIAERIKAERRL